MARGGAQQPCGWQLGPPELQQLACGSAAVKDVQLARQPVTLRGGATWAIGCAAVRPLRSHAAMKSTAPRMICIVFPFAIATEVEACLVEAESKCSRASRSMQCCDSCRGQNSVPHACAAGDFYSGVGQCRHRSEREVGTIETLTIGMMVDRARSAVLYIGG